ncbi:MAG: hypothetical protein KDH97_03885, partial [Calditrichaeota bacterium]|nr:hypothetical protein [Calditrichota bacterium]
NRITPMPTKQMASFRANIMVDLLVDISPLQAESKKTQDKANAWRSINRGPSHQIVREQFLLPSEKDYD